MIVIFFQMVLHALRGVHKIKLMVYMQVTLQFN